jgi:hypothetical protein
MSEARPSSSIIFTPFSRACANTGGQTPLTEEY